jgi:hypothetical protein
MPSAFQFTQKGKLLKIQTDGAAVDSGATKIASYSKPDNGAKAGEFKTHYHLIYEAMLLKNKGLTNMQQYNIGTNVY